MAVVVVSALMRLVCEKVASKALEELGMLLGANKELRKLESTLSTIQDVLEDAETRQVKEKALQGWLSKLRDMAYEIDDVLDEFITKADKWRQDAEQNMKAKVRGLLSVPKSIKLRHKIAHRIKEIRVRLDEIAEERNKFHLRQGLVKDWKEETGEREQTGSFVNESEVFGRDEDREKIVDFLITMSSEGDPDVIPIVGLGGLGKTTLAQLAYNDERVGKHFDQMIWISVSDEFDNRRLARSIIEAMGGRGCDLADMSSLQLVLRQQLGGKRFLLVLDDVWNENHEKWDRLRILLTGCARGSKVIVTTRSARVASIMGTVSPHLLTGLSDEHCWSLFEKRAFGMGGAEKTTNLVAIGKEIVKKCGGVPLAAKALGSLMRFRRGESAWLAVKDNEIWRLSEDENEILPALKLSYNHLPSRLKPCFAYCAIFPKNYEIRSAKLVHLWMAEGLISCLDPSQQLEDVGYQYLEELLSRSLFQDGSKDNDDVVRQVKMHDLVHDLACSVAGDECSIVDAGSGKGIPQSARYASFVCKEPVSVNVKPVSEARTLRTFHLVASNRLNAAASRGQNEEQDKMPEILDNLFSNLKLLRALHLSCCPMKELPVLVGKMIHLRYLDLSLTNLPVLPPCISLLQNLQTLDLACCRELSALPESIGELQNLSTLDLEGCSRLLSLPTSIGNLKNLRKLDVSLCQYMQELPESVSSLLNLQVLRLRHCYGIRQLPENTKNMKSLIHLDITSCVELTCMPTGIGQLTRLRTLPRFVLGGKTQCSIKELGGLNIGGSLHIKNLENVKNPADAEEANLQQKQHIRSLGLSWNSNAYRKPRQSGENSIDDTEALIEFLLLHEMIPDADYVDDVLENLRPYSGLEELEIDGFVGKKLPSWVMEFSLPNLVEVTLSSCIRCDRLPALGQVPHLKVLRLSLLFGISSLNDEFYGGNGAFPVLQELELSRMLVLEEWSGTSDGVLFPRLTKLCVDGCPVLRALPSAFPTVTHLRLDVDDELMLAALEDGAFPNLEHLDMRECDGDPDNCVDNLPQVLADRMDSINSWRIQTRARPDDNDPSTSSSFCMAKFNVMGGPNPTVFPLF